MKANPRILLTNDDGVDAPGLAVLLDIARDLSDDVWVVAPTNNQSGTGHRMTFGYEIEIEARGERIFCLDGTPADCVVAGITHVLKDKRPDIVLSGVNRGQNLGDIMHCSGTAAGAREGALHGAIGIALSQAMDYDHGRDEIDWGPAAELGAETVRSILDVAGARDTYFNVNFPICAPSEVNGIRLVPHQRFAHSPFELYPSDNPGKHFVTILNTPKPLDAGADFHILHEDKAITVTPLMLQQTDMEFVQRHQGRLPFTGPARA
ncbi:5'/3'-nucleotidase SurE [Pelagibacterium halotolerans]|uniref:5'-nucleotidase SurE n=1 Tax=Pelagibacterium halotolerans (strain DSM 22347 / JCM 15775 / CGMCC 1.7692 / B2) TaxID=1082931 RepID=G4R9T5_PELHB|nr:5'/3'-nucleotidase SurE [Pelagibacterium halotolerans]AEQ51492.1 5-nucleotidase SurE [Pelagibacterium halotolerans B2]QJR18669.1 5'/3'-nucleotidase SurE [Pelagibacterium halotolerans]SEA15045.1 5'-nucleotidase /3'-nucleotidase /exopolyphosphatase [Pelagibacterium halotolerans]